MCQSSGAQNGYGMLDSVHKTLSNKMAYEIFPRSPTFGLIGSQCSPEIVDSADLVWLRSVKYWLKYDDLQVSTHYYLHENLPFRDVCEISIRSPPEPVMCPTWSL